MAILTEQLHFSAKGSLNQTEDWWTLCYDTDASEFYIEHQWDHMDPYNLGKKTEAGKSRLPLCRSILEDRWRRPPQSQ